MKSKEEILLSYGVSITQDGNDYMKYGCTLTKIKLAMQEYAEAQCKAYKELSPVSFKLIGEIIDNYEADAINLPAEMYNDLKFHWKRLKQLINDK